MRSSGALRFYAEFPRGKQKLCHCKITIYGADMVHRAVKNIVRFSSARTRDGNFSGRKSPYFSF